MIPKNRVLLLMCLAVGLGYMPWYNFSAVLSDLAREFSLGSADTGFILAAFQAGYVVVVSLTGWLADRVGHRAVLFWATLLTGLSAVLFPFAAEGFASILCLRLLTGLAAGAIYVPGMALLAGWFGSAERGRALGAYTGAMVASYAGGYLLAANLSAAYGWRVGVLATSLPALLAVPLLRLVPAAPPAGHEPSPAAPAAPAAPGRPEAISPRGASLGGPALITLGYVGHMWELYAFWAWVGPFLVAAGLAGGLAAGQAVRWGGTLASLIILLGAVAVYLGGLAADRRGRTAIIILAGLASALGELVVGHLLGHGLGLATAGAVWVGLWVNADSAVFKAGLTELVSAKVRGLALGLQSVAGFGATIVAPVCFGWVLEWQNGPGDPTRAGSWGLPFAILGGGGLLAPLAALLLRRHRQARLLAGGRR